jgi:hypothetical protein
MAGFAVVLNTHHVLSPYGIVAVGICIVGSILHHHSVGPCLHEDLSVVESAGVIRLLIAVPEVPVLHSVHNQMGLQVA